MKLSMKLLISTALAFAVFISLMTFYFVFAVIFECRHYPIDDIENSIQGDFEIVGLTRACPTARPHGEFYPKHKTDTSDGYKRRNLIVESKSGYTVDVKWLDDNVIEVTAYREGSVRKISKSVFGN